MGRYSLTYNRTETDVLTFNVSPSEPINLVGAKLFFTVKTAPDADETDATAVIQKEITTFTGTGSAFSATFAITETDTDIAARLYKYDVKLLDGDGNMYFVVEVDNFEIRNPITNRVA
jgi:hypothetical protein